MNKITFLFKIKLIMKKLRDLVFLKLILIIFPMFAVNSTYSQIAINKKAGVIFRIDDSQNKQNWIDYANLFNSYGKSFCFAQNLDAAISDTSYQNLFKSLISQGHELIDHSPSHTVSYITVSSLADTAAYSGKTFVNHINGRKICFNYILPDIGNFAVANGSISNGNMLISNNPGEFYNIFSNPYNFAVYINNLNATYIISSVKNLNQSDADTLILNSFWNESISLTAINNVSFCKITPSDIKFSTAVKNELAKRTSDQCIKYQLPQPKTFCYPGGSFPNMTRSEIKEIWGDLYSYKAGSSFQGAYKCYNEYDPDDNKRFGMKWGDFYEERQTVDEIIKEISNNYAKHYLSIGQSHFYNLSGGWSGYLARMDSLLNWLTVNNIPVKTYSEWAGYLYDSIPDPYVNIIPSEANDLNNDHNPDGYEYKNTWDIADGVSESNYKGFKATADNLLFEIQKLAGIESGLCSFSAYTKGGFQDSIKIVFTFQENTLWITKKIAADSQNWTKRRFTFEIPQGLSSINITAYAVSDGNDTVKISGMELRKASELHFNAIPNQKKFSNQLFDNINMNNYIYDDYYANNDLQINIQSQNLNYTLINNQLHITKPSKFYTGTDTVFISVTNPDNNTVNNYVVFESVNPQICASDSVLIEDITATGIISTPSDNNLNFSTNNFYLKPSQNTTYTISYLQNNQSITENLIIEVYNFLNLDAGNDISVCVGDSIKLNANGGNVYEWNHNVINNAFFIPQTDGYYTVASANIIGCISKDSLQISFLPTPDAGIIQNHSPICYNTQANLNVINTSGNINWQIFENGTWNDILNANATSYQTGVLNQNKNFRIKASNSYCSDRFSSPLLLIVNPITNAGLLTTDNEVCMNTSARLELSGHNGNISWEMSADGISNWINIANSGMVNAVFNTQNLLTPTYFRAKVQNDNCNIEYSNIVFVNIKASGVAGTISSNTDVCLGTSATLMLSGNTGSIQWQKSENNQWIDIIGETNNILITAPLTTASSFRAKINYDNCPAIYTDISTININQPSNAGNITAASQVCQGTDVIISNFNQNGQISWEESTDSLNWFSVTSGIVNNQLIKTNIQESTWFRTKSQNFSCPEVYALPIKIKVDSVTNAGIANAVSPVCKANSTTVNLSNYRGSIQWQVSWNWGTSWTNINTYPGAKTAELTVPNVSSDALFRAQVKNGVCPSMYSVADTIIVNYSSLGGSNNITPVVCENKSTKCYLSNSRGSIQWQESADGINFTDVTGGTNINASPYTTPLLQNSRFYRAKVTNGACPSAYSNIDTAIVIPYTTPSISIGLISGNNPQFSPADSLVFKAEFTNAGTKPIFQWKNNMSFIGNNDSILKYLPQNGNLIKCEITSNAACPNPSKVTSNEIPISILSNQSAISGIIDNVNPICYNTSANLHLSNSNGDIYWQIYENSQWQDIANANSEFYTTSLLTSNKSYRAKVINQAYPPAYSNIVNVIVSAQLIAGYISASDTLVCSGSSVNLQLSSYNGNISWQSSSDGINWTDALGSFLNNPVYNTPAILNNMYFRAKIWENNCQEVYSDTIFVGVNNNMTISNISVQSPVCEGGSSLLNLNENINSIQWQQSDNMGLTWNDINGANQNQYNFTNLNNNTYFRAKISTGNCNNIFTNIDSVIVNRMSLAGEISLPSLVCQGSNVNLTLSNYNGNIIWQKSVDTINWQNISSVFNNNILTYNNIETSYWFRTIAVNGVCPENISTAKRINVDSLSDGGVAIAVSPVCKNNSTTITLNTYRGSVQWQVKWTSSSAWNNISTYPGYNSGVLTVPIVNSDGIFRAEVKNGVCPSVYSVSDTIIVNFPSVGGNNNVISPICQNKTTNCYLSASLGSIQWQESSNNIDWVDVTSGSGINSSPYKTPALTSTKFYRAKVTNGACPSAFSNSDTAIVNPIITPTVSIAMIAGNNPQTAPADSVTLQASITNGGSNPIYQWKNGYSNVGSNKNTYRFLPLHNNQIKCQLTSNAICVSSTSVTSNIITFLVYKASSAFSPENLPKEMCLNDNPYDVSRFQDIFTVNFNGNQLNTINPKELENGNNVLHITYYNQNKEIINNRLWEINIKNCNQYLINENEIITLYPNPAADELNVRINDRFNHSCIVIENMNAQEVYKQNLNSTDNKEIKISINHLKNGIYLFKYISENEVTVKKLIIDK